MPARLPGPNNPCLTCISGWHQSNPILAFLPKLWTCPCQAGDDQEESSHLSCPCLYSLQLWDQSPLQAEICYWAEAPALPQGEHVGTQLLGSLGSSYITAQAKGWAKMETPMASGHEPH